MHTQTYISVLNFCMLFMVKAPISLIMIILGMLIGVPNLILVRDRNMTLLPVLENLTLNIESVLKITRCWNTSFPLLWISLKSTVKKMP